MKQHPYSESSPSRRHGDRRKRRMTIHVRAFILLLTLPLLLFLLVTYLYLLWGMAMVSSGADRAKSAYLPRILENQRTAINLEAIRRNATLVYLERDPEKRRAARLAAQTLGMGITLNAENDFDKAIHAIHTQFNLLENQCIVLDEAQVDAQTGIIKLQTALQSLPLYQEGRTLSAISLAEIQSVPFVLALTEIEDLNQIQRIQDELVRRVDALTVSDLHISQEKMEQLRFLVTQAFNGYAHVSMLKAQARIYWESMDASLRTLRNQLNVDAVDSAYSTLLSIDSRISWMSRAAYAVCFCMILAFVSLVVLLHVYIVRPIMLTSRKLQNIRTGKNSPPMPPLNIAELNEVSSLINIANDQIALLYRHTRELEKEKEQIENIAIVDGLTGIYNRRYFDLQYNALREGALLKSDPLSVIFMDIDHFKLYNDTLGHSAGDDCLVRVAQAIQTSLYRKSDMAFRYGGEEFVVLLPSCMNGAALTLAERIRMHIRSLEIAHPNSPVSPVVTVSVGVATLDPACPVDGKHLLNLADSAMYRAKSEGRNQVCSA